MTTGATTAGTAARATATTITATVITASIRAAGSAGANPPVFWSPNRFHISPYRAPYGFYARSWGFGEFLPRGWFAEPYWIGDFIDYDLPYPPPGYEWVRVGDDAIMVDRYTGRVVQVVRGIFW